MAFTEDLVVGIVGAGTMGVGIAQVAASAGHKTIVSDSNSAALANAKDGLEKTFAKLVEKGKVKDDEAKNILLRISYNTDLNDFKNCGLIIESIVEGLQVKQNL